MSFPFLDFESSFFTNEELLFLAGASGGGGVEHTIINNPATFTTDLAKPLRRLVIPFTPVQSGSGDPSPDNVRPITGFTGLNIYRSGEDTSDPLTIPVSWQSEAGGVYGGTLDALSGVLTTTHILIDLTDVTYWEKSSSYPGGFYSYTERLGIKSFTPFICSHAKTATTLAQYVQGTCYCDGSINIRIMPEGSELTDWNTYRQEQSQNGTPVCIAGELRTPQTVQLDPVTLSTLKGYNVIWTDTNGDNTIVYLKKT